MSVGIPSVVHKLANDALARFSAARGRAHSAFSRRRDGHADIRRDRIDALGGAQETSPHRADQLRLFGIARPVTAHAQARHAGLAPGFLAEAFGARHRNFGPPARVRNLNQAMHDLGVLARRAEASSEILERWRTVGEEEPMSVLDESIPHGLRDGPGIGVCALKWARRSGRGRRGGGCTLGRRRLAWRAFESPGLATGLNGIDRRLSRGALRAWRRALD